MVIQIQSIKNLLMHQKQYDKEFGVLRVIKFLEKMLQNFLYLRSIVHCGKKRLHVIPR